MTRVALGVVVVVSVLAGILALKSGLESDEARILRLFEDLVADFNDGDARGIRDALHPDFALSPEGYDREAVRYGLVQWFAHSGRGAAPLRAELDGDRVDLSDLEQDRARYRCEARLVDSPVADPAWSFEAEGELRREDGSWLIHTARIRTISGQRPTRLRGPR